MAIPLQQVNLRPYEQNPMLSVEQIAQGLNGLTRPVLQGEEIGLMRKELPYKVALEQAQAKKALIANPLERYTFIPDEITGGYSIGDKVTGKTYPSTYFDNTIPSTPATPSTSPPPSTPSIPPAKVDKVAVPSKGLGKVPSQQRTNDITSQTPTTPPSMGNILTGAEQGDSFPQMPQLIRNLLTGSYRAQGVQNTYRDPSGDWISVTSPTNTATTQAETGEAGEKAFDAVYPYMGAAIKAMGSVTYGKGWSNLIKSAIKKPTPSNAKQLALFLAVRKIGPSIAGDLGRMTTQSAPHATTMNNYFKNAYNQLPSAEWIKAGLLTNPKLADMVNAYTATYYQQLEDMIQKARNKSIMTQSPTNLGKNIAITPEGAPLTIGGPNV